MRALAAWLLAAFLLPAWAGCLDRAGPDLSPNDGVVTGARGPDDYWLVRVTGQEDRTARTPGPQSVAMCSLAFSHSIDTANRELTFASRQYPDVTAGDFDVLVAFEHFDHGSCPLAYGLRLGGGPHAADMGHYGNISLSVEANGDVVLDDARIPLGQTGAYHYDDTTIEGGVVFDVVGAFKVTNLGAWPVAGVSAQG